MGRPEIDIRDSIECPPSGWDARLVAADESAGLRQTAFWADTIGELDNATPHFLEVRVGGDVVAALLFFHKILWDRDRNTGQAGLLRCVPGLRRGWLEWADGPVFLESEHQTVSAALGAILVWIGNYADEHGIPMVKSTGFPVTSSLGSSSAISDQFGKHGYSQDEWATYLVDLDRDEEAIWRSLKPTARKGVNRATREGSSVAAITTINELENRFYVPYCEFEEAHGRKAASFRTMRTMWQRDMSGYYRFFVAQDREAGVIANLGMYIYNGVATEIASAISPAAYEAKIPVQDLLHWELIREARRSGCHAFNLGGVNPNPKTDKERGIRRFKEKWGGRLVTYSRYTREDRSAARAILERVLSIPGFRRGLRSLDSHLRRLQR